MGGAARAHVEAKFDRDANLPAVVEALAEAGILRLVSAASGSEEGRSLRAVA